MKFNDMSGLARKKLVKLAAMGLVQDIHRRNGRWTYRRTEKGERVLEVLQERLTDMEYLLLRGTY